MSIFVLSFLACASVSPSPSSDPDPDPEPDPTGLADVVQVSVSGEAAAAVFSVTLSSPDTGCTQYADWWEVLSQDGALITRRVLGHSHVDDQPFTRSGSPVEVSPQADLWVRAHMNPGGYGGQAMRGSLEQGFEIAALDEGFAAELAEVEPLPDGCAF